MNVIRVAPGKAIELFAFDTMRKLLVDEKGDSKLPVPLPPASVAGACAGLSSTCVCYPMEVVKTRLTVEAGKYSGIGDCFMSIARDEGVTALYRGLLASALGIIPYAATNYYTYDGLRKVYRKFKRKRMMKSGDTSSNINYIGPLPTLVRVSCRNHHEMRSLPFCCSSLHFSFPSARLFLSHACPLTTRTFSPCLAREH